MRFFDLFKKNKSIKAPKWSDLTSKQRAAISKRILNMAGPQYTVVSGGFDETQRRRAIVERQSETEILDGYKRGRLLDLVRNACRSSASWQTILKQYDYNAVGVNGGKVILNFPDAKLAKELRDRFADWTRNADFFDGLSFNYLLKLIFKTILVGGDTLIQFDDHILDSGRLLVYESDELGEIPQKDLVETYGEGSHQSQGKVYDKYGRWIGAVVSRNQRGEQVFDAAKSFLLKRDPDASIFDSSWIMPQNFWRVRQGRGVTQAASSIATILDMEDLCQFELQAAKSNSRTFAQIYHTGAKEEQVQVPSTFDDADLQGMTDEEIEAAARAEAEQEKVVRFDKAASCGVVFEQLPQDWKMELLQTPHPNEKIVEYVKWLAGRSSAAFGLSEAYATMTPTGESFRAQQLMT